LEGLWIGKCWYIFLPFRMFYGHLGYLWPFGTFFRIGYQEKSGNPGPNVSYKAPFCPDDIGTDWEGNVCPADAVKKTRRSAVHRTIIKPTPSDLPTLKNTKMSDT
jgi:hypothetical protein